MIASKGAIAVWFVRLWLCVYGVYAKAYQLLRKQSDTVEALTVAVGYRFVAGKKILSQSKTPAALFDYSLRKRIHYHGLRRRIP